MQFRIGGLVGLVDIADLMTSPTSWSEMSSMFYFTKFLFQVPLFFYSPSQPFLFLRERCVTRQKTASRKTNRRAVLGAKLCH